MVHFRFIQRGIIYCMLYALACFFIHFRVPALLYIARFLGGISTSLLYSVFEAWMVGEHCGRHGWSGALLSRHFSLLTFANFCAAAITGMVAEGVNY